MGLPGPDLAVAAGRTAEFAAMAAVVGEPLPPLYRTRCAGEPLRIVYLMPRTGAGGVARCPLRAREPLLSSGGGGDGRVALSAAGLVRSRS